MPVLSGSASTEADADLSRCWTLVEDVASAPQWQGGLEQMNVLERDEHGRPILCDTVTDAKISKVHSRIRFSYEPRTRLSWTQVQGEDLELMNGSWELEDLGEGRTRVTYSIEVDPGPVGRFARGPIQRVIRAMLVGARPKELAERASRG